MYLKTVCASLVMATLFCIADTQVIQGEKVDAVNEKKVVDEERMELTSKQSDSYVMTNAKQKDVKVPPLLKTTGEFLPRYQARLQVLNKIHIIDLSSNKKQYESKNIYQEGQLTKPVFLQIEEYSQLMPIITVDGKGTRGVQLVKDPIKNDVMGELISVWFYRDKQWELHEVTFKSNGKKFYHYYEIE